jgi:uncharacterized protein (DUF111 family)
MDAVALDISVIPVLMKKNRPGHLLRVITKPKDSSTVSEAIIRETGTLGVRVLPYVHRNIVKREIVPLKLDIGGLEHDIQIKIGMIGEEVINYSPEYEDAKKIAGETGVPLKDVMKRANNAFKKLLDNY